MVDPAYRQKLGVAGRADVLARWTWEAAARRVETHLYAQAAQYTNVVANAGLVQIRK
jgi:hypothetical protein